MSKSKDNNNSLLDQVPMNYWSGLAFFIVVTMLMIFGLVKVYQSMMQDEASPVSSLVIKGKTPYTFNAEIVAALRQGELDNFFQLDVNLVQHELEQLPWVYSASVRKQWPDTVSVYVIDQTPVAQWNDDFFINEQGVIFQADQTRVAPGLPKLFGPEGSETLALATYRDLNLLLNYIEVEIDELVLSERHSWVLTLKDGVSLNLGREDRVMRVQRFMDAYRQIKSMAKQDMQVDYIDLRYDTGMAVGWKPKLEEEKTNA
ncbi:FtsQ-type POTRA domain-containing protein [Thalassotalea sp. HSM 43]|uniref:cell division protein FtsQ/DivIB n=1 Tax=Thalassotalea sp. HSM 43 TaxID=2552945 RepID=UPI0010811A02|nr:cell division protein FtsQ/DivIB [Thalassotalea sp. HSM 43]QBY04827.1 FtsQ-type POTRA domain-containing protein [Thalassotalea sp. HSM 43]